MLHLYESSSTRGMGKNPARLHHSRCVAWRRLGNINHRLRNHIAEIIANITQLDSSNYSHVNYSEMSSFAHDSATMSLECHSRQARGEDIRRLIFTCHLKEFHLSLITRSELPYPMNTSVNVLGTRIHTTPFDEEDTRIVILRYESRRCLLIS